MQENQEIEIESSQIIFIDEETRQIADADADFGRWHKGDEVALVFDEYGWGWACVKVKNEKFCAEK